MDYCRDFIILENDQMASIARDDVAVYSFSKAPAAYEITRLEWSTEEAERDGYNHFMLKEIFQQPRSAADLLRQRLTADLDTRFPELDEIIPHDIEQIVLAACGTASYV